MRSRKDGLLLRGSSLLVFPLAALLTGFAPIQQAVVGTIQSYECGDNCYLTIETSDRTQLTGLCAAPLCEEWNEAVEMPADLVGRPVTVTLDVGTQLNGEGEVMGPFIAFVEIAYD